MLHITLVVMDTHMAAMGTHMAAMGTLMTAMGTTMVAMGTLTEHTATPKVPMRATSRPQTRTTTRRCHTLLVTLLQARGQLRLWGLVALVPSRWALPRPGARQRDCRWRQLITATLRRPRWTVPSAVPPIAMTPTQASNDRSSYVLILGCKIANLLSL